MDKFSYTQLYVVLNGLHMTMAIEINDYVLINHSEIVGLTKFK